MGMFCRVGGCLISPLFQFKLNLNITANLRDRLQLKFDWDSYYSVSQLLLSSCSGNRCYWPLRVCVNYRETEEGESCLFIVCFIPGVLIDLIIIILPSESLQDKIEFNKLKACLSHEPPMEGLIKIYRELKIEKALGQKT